jgi:membrane-associated phospholipid phosphatase
MAEWIRWSIAFVGYAAVAAAVRPGVSTPARLRAWGGCAFAAALLAIAWRLPRESVANVWILPPIVLLAGYWTTGRLFVRPMPWAERVLGSLDRRWHIQAIATRCPPLAGELLELAYSSIYIVIGVALLLALRSGVTADRFWTVILVTDYVCFGMLPWFQTRPPRDVGFDVPWQSRWRGVNERLLEAGGVRVNTFPSGHAAEALAAALLVTGAPAAFVAGMFFAALAISAGAVLGRYHYALDAIAGWAVAVVVWWAL